MQGLLDLLIAHNVTLSQLETVTGVPEREIMEWCTGIGEPDAATSAAMAGFIGCSLRSLYLAILHTRDKVHGH